MKTKILFPLCLLFLLFSFAPALQAAAPDFDFYKGKMVKIIVTYGAGGGMDAYARLVAPYLGKYLGATVVVINDGAAGGIAGRNKVYQAKPDGLTIGFSIVNGAIIAEWAELQGVMYQTEKFRYIGKIYSEPSVMLTSVKSHLTSIDDIIKAKNIRTGATGVGGDDYYAIHMAAKALGFTVDMITGFASSMEANLSAVKGDVQAVQVTWTTAFPLITNGDLIPVLVYNATRLPELPKVPTVIEMAEGNNKKVMEGYLRLMELQRVMFAPPGMSDERLQALRDALAKVVQDPEFKAETVKNKRPVVFSSGEEVEKIFKTLQDVKSTLQPQVKELTKKTQG